MVAVAAGHGDGAGVGADVEAGPEHPLLRRHGPGPGQNITCMSGAGWHLVTVMLPWSLVRWQ